MTRDTLGLTHAMTLGFFVLVALAATASAQPPLPGPGETIHWTSEDSPVVINAYYDIVAGGTVIVDPGVEIQRTAQGRLYVRGVLRMEGTPAEPVLLRGANALIAPAVFVATGGRADLDHVDSTLRVHAGVGALVVTNSVFRGAVEPAEYADDYRMTGVSGYRAIVVIRDTLFDRSVIESNEAYVTIDRLTLVASRFFLRRYDAGQPVVLDTIDAQGMTANAPFLLTGYDYWFGPNNQITGNLYPVHLYGGGIAATSTLPASGNTNDYVHAGIGEAVGQTTFADVGLPYVVLHDESFPSLGGRLTIEPGVTVLLGPEARIAADFGGNLVARGTASRPITFDRLDPAVPWEGLYFRINRTRPRLEYCNIFGANVGAWTLETDLVARRCRFENNVIGANSQNWGTFIARECLFLANDTGYKSETFGVLDGFADLSDPDMPNWFEGNGVGVAVENFRNNSVLAQNCYWGDPTGPSHPGNPGGQGDIAEAGSQVLPFLTNAPDSTDLPPEIRLIEPYWLLEEGAKVILHWEAQDDGAIAEQRILYSSHSGAIPLTTLVADIDPAARSVEITVPQREQHSSTSPAVLRLAVVDDAGKESVDDFLFTTPFVDFEGGLSVDPVPALVRPAQTVEVCSRTEPGTPLGTRDGYLVLDTDSQTMSIGGTTVECLDGRMPAVSTDAARFAIRLNVGAGGRALWGFSEEFSIRPDSTVTGDEPPVVDLVTPMDGQTFPAGSVVPITWTASDDEALRSFDVQASYDGARTWHGVTHGLPGTTRSYDWRLPTPCDIADVRVRVIARDWRFQNTSAGADRVLSVTPEASGLFVTLTVQSPMVAAGDFLVFDAVVGNAGSVAETFDAWLDVIKPNGVPSSRNPIAGPRTLTLAPGGSVQRTVRIRVPASTPPSGPYTLVASLGGFPDEIAARDSFEFEVIAP